MQNLRKNCNLKFSKKKSPKNHEKRENFLKKTALFKTLKLPLPFARTFMSWCKYTPACHTLYYMTQAREAGPRAASRVRGGREVADAPKVTFRVQRADSHERE